MNISDRIASFKYAINGIIFLIKSETNAQIHLAITIFTIMAGFFFSISAYEWLAIIISMGLVFAMEALNTAVEKTVDFITLDKIEALKNIKDVAAGAVLISAISALAVASIIFLPKIWFWLH